jgi:glucokinase
MKRRIVRQQPVVLGIDFGGTKVAVAVGELDGTRLGLSSVRRRPGTTAAEYMRDGIDEANRLRAEVAAGREIAAIGACTFGIPSREGVALAPTVDGWEDVPFGRVIEESLGATVVMATDVKAAAAAEATWGSLVDSDPSIYLNLGTGLAAAIVIDGKVLSGNDGAAGEIGYNLRALGDVGHRLEGQAPLEEAVGGKGLGARASLLVGSPTSASELFARTDPQSMALVDEALTELSMHVVNLSIAINPARVAVGGGMVRSWDRIRPVLENALRVGVPYPPELVSAVFALDAPVIGALAMGTRAAAADRGDLRKPPSTTRSTLVNNPQA